MIAKEKGVIFGRPKITCTAEQIKLFEDVINKKIAITKAIAISNMSCGTFYKYLNILRINTK